MIKYTPSELNLSCAHGSFLVWTCCTCAGCKERITSVQMCSIITRSYIVLVDSTSTQIYTLSWDFWAIALDGLCCIRNPGQMCEALFSAQTKFTCGKKTHLWNCRLVFSLGLRWQHYCFRYLLVKERILPVLSINLLLACMKANKQKVAVLLYVVFSTMQSKKLF